MFPACWQTMTIVLKSLGSLAETGVAVPFVMLMFFGNDESFAYPVGGTSSIVYVPPVKLAIVHVPDMLVVHEPAEDPVGTPLATPAGE